MKLICKLWICNLQTSISYMYISRRYNFEKRSTEFFFLYFETVCKFSTSKIYDKIHLLTRWIFCGRRLTAQNASLFFTSSPRKRLKKYYLICSLCKALVAAKWNFKLIVQHMVTEIYPNRPYIHRTSLNGKNTQFCADISTKGGMHIILYVIVHTKYDKDGIQYFSDWTSFCHGMGHGIVQSQPV